MTDDYDWGRTKRYDYAIDWDDTLVDVHTKAWLPGAREALGAFALAGRTMIVHSCRANFVEGENQIRLRLADAGLDKHVDVWTGRGKPDAKVYIDNLAVRFDGDWDKLRKVI